MQSNDTSLSHRQSITVTSDHYATSQAVVNAADGVVIDWRKGVTITGTPTKTEGELVRIKNANPEDVLAVLIGDEL